MKRGMAVAVHGGDHKNGVTMITQCIAEHLVEHLEDDSAVSLVLHGDNGGDYCGASVQSVEGMRSYLEQNLLNCQELLRDCRVQERFFLMRGITRPEQKRLYHPKLSEYLLDAMRKQASFVIADTGSEIDDGLAMGALKAADLRYLVLTQQESTLSHWERSQTVYRRLGIDFQAILINRYLPEAAYTKEYLAERLGFPVDRILTISDSPYGLRADGEKKSLLQYKDERVRQSIRSVCERLTEQAGINYPPEKRWKWWKSST